MVSITRNVSDIPVGDLPALEHFVGSPLRPNQQVIVQVVDNESVPENAPSDAPAPQLPEWFNVYEGLSDEEIDRLEDGFQRLELRRNSEFEDRV